MDSKISELINENLNKIDWVLTLSELELQIERIIEYYNNKRYYELLNNVTPSDIYFGKDKKIKEWRQRVKKTLVLRKQQNLIPDNKHFNKNRLDLLNTIF
jgi:hypothetical protein